MDKFYFDTLTDLHPELKKLIKLILTLSHGQASIERGFNVNKFIDHVNMEENSFISRKLIIDHMKQKGLQPDRSIMKSGFIKSVKAARKRYDIYLEERRSEKEEGQKSKQKQILQCEIDQLKSYQNTLQDLCKSLDKKIVGLMEEIEKKMDLKIVSKENALKQKREKKGKEIDDLNKAIPIIEQNKQNLG